MIRLQVRGTLAVGFTILPQEEARALYPNIFDFYSIRDKNGGDADTSFCIFCNKYEVKGYQMAKRNKKPVVLTFPTRSNSRMSRYYDQYCKYFLVKHKPCHGSIESAWGGPITDPESDDPVSILEDDH